MVARLTNISFDEVTSYLGHTDIKKISESWEALKEVCSPKITYKIYETEKAAFLVGNDIKQLLKDCKKCVVFAATLGLSADRHLAKLQISNMADALIFDTLASCAIENICDNFCMDMEAELGNTTRRFSPGYGDFPLEIQTELSKLLEMQKSAGITLTDAGLMVPQKSITAVFGISNAPQNKEISCKACSMYCTCSLRKENKHCE